VRINWAPVLALALLALARLPETLIILRVQDLGVSAVQIPLLWAALHVVRSAASYPGGWLSDHLGPRGTVAMGGAVFALVTGTLAQQLGVVAASLVFLVLGLVAGLSPKRMGSSFGGYHALTGLAALPAAVLFGALYERAGGERALLASLGLTLAAVAWWLVVQPSNDKENGRVA
jgi:MFS family permease